MYYSSFGILAVVLHCIINFDVLKNGKKNSSGEAHDRYRHFLNTILVFYILDLAWGFVMETGNRTLIFLTTTLFFFFMALSVLLWTRYVVAYLGKSGPRASLFLAGGWVIFGFIILLLFINIFDPAIFLITENAEYVPKPGRYALLIAQLILFFSIALYSLFVSFKAEGRDRTHYSAVCASGGAMGILILLQFFYPFVAFYTIGCLIANCLLHVFVEEDEKREMDQEKAKTEKEKEIYNHIANSLAEDYEAIYYINIETGKYMEVSASESYKSLNVPMVGEDFYKETRENAARYAHPDDRNFAVSMYYRDTMLKNLEGRKSFSYTYRIIKGDEIRHFRFVVMLADDGEHFVLGDKDIQDTITAETAFLEKQKINITFSQIAESLASNYDVIYYVDSRTGEYVGYTSHNIYGTLRVDQTGDDFFEISKKNASFLIHPWDREKLLGILDKNYLISTLEGRKQVNLEYRMIVDDRMQYTRLSARKSSDGLHFIIGVENIDDEVRREREHLRALNTERELARRDELTGARNKTAYTELEKSLQHAIESNDEDLAFSLVVCDLNDLKKINDSEGHKAGDEYIRTSAKFLCDLFDHSPVFRIGGDEFVIYLNGKDYVSRNELVASLRGTSRENLEKREGPVIAVGMADFRQDEDLNVSMIFERADQEMYEDKRKLKNLM